MDLPMMVLVGFGLDLVQTDCLATILPFTSSLLLFFAISLFIMIAAVL
jgi:hypothetical protein